MAVVDPTKGFDLPKFDKRILDLTTQRFGRLTVVSFAGRNHRNLIVWICLCDCGNSTLATSAGLRNKCVRSSKRSCGCLASDVTRERSTTHQSRHTTEYRSWRAMKDRCLRPTATGYERYGGRGITICDRWLNSFENFIADMGPQPAGDYSLDRINNDGNYEPGNCRWATRVEQSNNRRQAKPRLLIEFNGEAKTPHQWAEHLGITVGTIYMRRWKGWPIEKVLSVDLRFS